MENNAYHKKFIATFILAFALIYTDINFTFLTPVREALSVVIYPFRFVGALPGNLYDGITDYAVSRQKMLDEMEQLKTKVSINDARLKSFEFFENENTELRNKLDIGQPPKGEWLVVEIERNINQPFSSEIFLAKGGLDNITPGNAVVDEYGILGQVVQVDVATSKVNLITNINQMLSGRVKRNNTFVALSGNGSDKLLVQFASNNTDLQLGDELYAVGENYPPGYPIGEITAIEKGAIYLNAEVTPYSRFKDNTVVMLYINEAAE